MKELIELIPHALILTGIGVCVLVTINFFYIRRKKSKKQSTN